MKELVKAVLPQTIWDKLGHIRKKLKNLYFQSLIKLSRRAGLDVYPISNMYSPLPEISHLKHNINRWCKPSEMIGVEYDIESMKEFLNNLEKKYSDEYKTFNIYKEYDAKEYGVGFTKMDAMLLYYMVRDIKPSRYIEVGSGLSTKYCTLAAKQNAEMGKPVKITCIEPYPYEMLYTIPQIEIIAKEVQDVELSVFEELGPGDILFIDTSHIVKLDGDVPFLFLEVVPRLKKGVFIHVHDIPFPYNVPYPEDFYIFGRKLPKYWPWFFTEAMLLQAFLSYNDVFKILTSIPLIRYHDENFLSKKISGYTRLSDYSIENQQLSGFPPCSIWIEKVK
jgi:hypothetical protein